MFAGRSAAVIGALGIGLAAASAPAASPRAPSAAAARAADVSSAPAREATRTPLAAIGRAIFFDATLSEPAGTSCATCHDPAHGYAGNNGSTLGVAQGSRPGHYAKRNTPSVLYLRFVRRFHFHWEEDAPLPDARGGFFWDGRADSIAELTRQPLLNADEMGNHDSGQVAAKLRLAAYADELRREAGPLDAPDDALGAAGKAVEAFLLGDEMSPFSSKYDDYVRGTVALSPLEARGLSLFKDDTKGACAFCHKLSDSSGDPSRSPFTDFGFEAVSAPRNTRLEANRDPRHFDLGLCEQHAHAHMDEPRLCGMFRTPSLRNVATRKAFMHSGAFSNLRDVVAFYATRATNPRRWYRTRLDRDLPEKFLENVNDHVAPYDRNEGDPPALDEGEIDALVAFLGTLTDAAFTEDRPLRR